MRMMLDECERRFGGVDILINNAGVGIFGNTVEDTEPDDFRWVIENKSVWSFLRLSLRDSENEIPGVVVISLTSRRLPARMRTPKMATYNASKFGLNGFSEALMQEVRQDDIKVSYICPGSVNTEFGGDTISKEKAWQLQPEDVAQTIVDLLHHHSRSLPSKIELRPSKPAC